MMRASAPTLIRSRVASEGFEPPNAEQSDLQSDPFGRLGNSPGAHPTGVVTDRRRSARILERHGVRNHGASGVAR